VNSNRNGIWCMYHDNRKRSFYIDEFLKVLPCCFYASAYINADNDENKILDSEFENESITNPGWNDLSKHTIEEMLENRIYKHHIFYNGWDSENPSEICLHTCGNKRKQPLIAKTMIK